MSLNDDQKRMLMTNLARDKAQQLRNDIRRMVEEAKTKDHSHLSEEDRRMGEYA